VRWPARFSPSYRGGRIQGYHCGDASNNLNVNWMRRKLKGKPITCTMFLYR
jgi:hypothetical protein